MKIHILILLALTLILNSCFSQNQNDIFGKWTVEEIENVGQYRGSADELRNSSFFGVERWFNAVGKNFEFRKDGHVETNLAELDLSGVIELTYVVSDKNDRVTFIATNLQNPKENVFEFFVEMEFADKDVMFWTIDKLHRYKLERTK